MNQPLILKQPGAQVRLSELPSDKNPISAEAAGRFVLGVIDASVIEVRTLRVLGNEQVVKWLDGR